MFVDLVLSYSYLATLLKNIMNVASWIPLRNNECYSYKQGQITNSQLCL